MKSFVVKRGSSITVSLDDDIEFEVQDEFSAKQQAADLAYDMGTIEHTDLDIEEVQE